MIVDGQFGSTGKGLWASYVAYNDKEALNVAMANCGPNSGHTFYMDDKKHVCYHLPVAGVARPESWIFLTAGSIIDPILLKREIEENGVDPHRIVIHPRAVLVTQGDKMYEEKSDSSTARLASTQKGTGRALARKVMREAQLAAAYVWPSGIEVNDMGRIILDRMELGQTFLMEVPQGFDLSLNHGLSYPYCTSRDINVAQALSDAGLHPYHLGTVMMTQRTYPIRVGHLYENRETSPNKFEDVKIGESGPFYADSTETTFAALGVAPETTTVTGRVRRIATWSQLQFTRSIRALRPDIIFTNFCNYMEQADVHDLHSRMAEICRKEGISSAYYTGYGPKVTDVRQGIPIVAPGQGVDHDRS